MFLPKLSHPEPLLHAPQGVGVQGRPPPKNLPPLEDHLHAKFHPDLSSILDFYREQTNKHTHIGLYLVDWAVALV